MRKFKYLRTKNNRTFLLPNGRMVDVYSCRYDCKVDLNTYTFLLSTDEGYKESSLPTMNELVDKNLVKEVSCVVKYEINFPPSVHKLKKKDFESIMAEFRENGFNVTMKALIHNYQCWLGDLKSGFRDNQNKYHLFTPCGCNPLSFSASTLHWKCRDWQTTYEW